MLYISYFILITLIGDGGGGGGGGD